MPHKRPDPTARKRTRGGIVGITGTPGAGKKSVAPLVAARLGLECHGITDLARKFGILKQGEEAVDTNRLRPRMAAMEASVVYGHLLPYVVGDEAVAGVAVLRCEPSTLKRRLVARGYPGRKVLEDVEAELIGLVSAEAFEAFGSGKTIEVDTSRSTPERTADRVVAALGGSGRGRKVDWTLRYDSGEKLRSLLSAVA